MGVRSGEGESTTHNATAETGMCDSPAYLELCVSRGLSSVHWGEIKLRDTNGLSVKNDASMFGTYMHNICASFCWSHRSYSADLLPRNDTPEV